MKDRQRALFLAHQAFLGETITSSASGIAEIVGNAMLEFAAEQVETVEGDPVFRAEELRSQKVG